MLTVLAFLLTIPAANWMIGHVGFCGAAGPCTIPVGFGLQAPSGVLLIGLALALRDAVHERYNAAVVFLVEHAERRLIIVQLVPVNARGLDLVSQCAAGGLLPCREGRCERDLLHRQRIATPARLARIYAGGPNSSSCCWSCGT